MKCDDICLTQLCMPKELVFCTQVIKIFWESMKGDFRQCVQLNIHMVCIFQSKCLLCQFRHSARNGVCAWGMCTHAASISCNKLLGHIQILKIVAAFDRCYKKYLFISRHFVL